MLKDFFFLAAALAFIVSGLILLRRGLTLKNQKNDEVNLKYIYFVAVTLISSGLFLGILLVFTSFRNPIVLPILTLINLGSLIPSSLKYKKLTGRFTAGFAFQILFGIALIGIIIDQL
jgi:hypothetical protein